MRVFQSARPNDDESINQNIDYVLVLLLAAESYYSMKA
jgi:hypothetical protein